MIDDAGRAADRPVSPLTVAGIAMASALVPLNSTMIAVALPEIADEYGIARVGPPCSSPSTSPRC